MTGATPAPPRPDSQRFWLSLNRLPGVGATAQRALLERFGAAEGIFAASGAQLEPLLPDRPEAVRAILAGPDEAALAQELDWLKEPRRHLLTWADPDYPALLREIADPPVLLYVHGERALLSAPQLAIVGSRNPTPAGRENARAFARALAASGLTITSGLALGIDGAAHRGALDAGGASIAVCGTGLDRVYPPRHRELAHELAARGALVSQFPLGTPPLAGNFPVRNRLISGLATGTLVVEAALGSGSLITARLAAEQGREVFAIPGSIHSPLARGCHALIRQGAKLVETAQDIVEELGPLARFACTPAAERVAPDAAHAGLLEFMGHDPVSVDTLVERSGLTADAVSSMLLQMELRGLVALGAGATYHRI
ncbi:MAG: DNA protecting protein DprA [Candidatus Muproteobacteria bacterium RBG_16_65_31]|uniref:DNA protecting protein DprA n=1 Tax=Candidatus Muproteobacteria bacterium RBG_16_65_31 TaxID=1817759 RepID=A0A1F6TJD7_9PROT|nr:MAG: DNA protecting protein DprA [Candidatus Muproteobacteria bacterium RBG_16_65_31]